jgi:hypothetical protein
MPSFTMYITNQEKGLGIGEKIDENSHSAEFSLKIFPLSNEGDRQ